MNGIELINVSAAALVPYSFLSLPVDCLIARLDIIFNDTASTIDAPITKTYIIYIMIETLAFSNYATIDKIERRTREQGYYEYNEVQKNFNKALDTLGSLDQKDWCAAITLRLKNKVKAKKIIDDIGTSEYIKTDWGIANSVARALRFKISAKYWGREGRKKKKMPMVRAIEANKLWFKEHLHIIVRFKDLKQYYDENEIRSYLIDTCYGLEEVNARDNTAVFVRMFRYWNDTNELGNTIEYICKTSTKHYNPLTEN